MLRHEAFGNNYKWGTAAVMRFSDPFNDLLDAGFPLRNQDGVGAGSHAGMQGDPADVASHDFCDHAAAVRLSGGPQAVDCLGGYLDGGVETEGVVGGVEIV